VIETWPFLAVLASALLHAAWNAIARAGGEPGDVVASGVIAAGIISIPGLIWFGLPSSASWPFLAAGIVMNTAGIRFAMAAYRHASFGLTYPAMRAGIPLLTLPVAAVVLREWPQPLAAAGVLLIAAAVVTLMLAARRGGRAERRGLGFALLAALAGAGYVTIDAMGVRQSGNVMGYAFALAICNGVVIAALTRLEGGTPLRTFRRYAPLAFGISVLSMASFLLYIWAVSVAPVALAAALRETSVLFAVGIATFILKEKTGPFHWTAAGLAFAGTVAIRLA
jgi:drug/metabolite transporter (DMT)-like permease